VYGRFLCWSNPTTFVNVQLICPESKCNLEYQHESCISYNYDHTKQHLFRRRSNTNFYTVYLLLFRSNCILCFWLISTLSIYYAYMKSEPCWGKNTNYLAQPISINRNWISEYKHKFSEILIRFQATKEKREKEKEKEIVLSKSTA